MAEEEIKVFNRWSAEGIKVDDVGLVGYISVKPRIVPRTGARYAGKRFHKSRTFIVKKLMNKLMVMLTIAISGGPFIGLLGTVLGVMITFAVIAATGDVNVAAIAPGIAAALMATAAGMAVAIPALFGYNYLNSRIKSITSDMRVFNDELITKLAENYSR